MIDPTAPDWPRMQAARIIREAIEAGAYPDGKLPSQERLAEQVGVAPKTIQKALEQLKAEGLVYGVPGRGTFVSR